ncbi:MAG TPA: YifB family Mg chelatase-like AAA ATPase [Gammaproteobacteria bacterium]|nr:YifB family Mg chelatase-like AAA ATPase [Gammaproteobacteria bacterium]
MGTAVIYSRAMSGIHAPEVTVEVHLSGGVPRFSIVGLPETAVKESKDRVRSALLNTYFEFPARRITVNLAPADLPKEGGRFDLPIALGILAASGQIPTLSLNHFEFCGELALTGSLRPIQGALPFALATREAKRQLILPLDNANEASLPEHLDVFPAQHLLEVCAHLLNSRPLPLHQRNPIIVENEPATDLADVRGQLLAKRSLEIAAAGQHSLLMTGPPGTGKTMLASRLNSILPLMTEAEALEAAAVLSIAGKPFNHQCWRLRPFRAPHHTASSVALVGGGSPPKPGEISLAHQGVLFLDELPEFNRSVLEALREPLESGSVTISRASYQAQFPARFQLIAAMNPCPCGYFGDASNRCQCTSEQIKRYQTRISGPLLDRMDMHIRVAGLPRGALASAKDPNTENSATVRARVIQARTLQQQRCNKTNSALSPREIEQHCVISVSDQQLLEQAIERFGLSARAYHRILKVARTIADLGGCDDIHTSHLTEALSYRCFDQPPGCRL